MALGDFFKKLFGSSPKEMADKAENLVEETFEKAKVAAAPLVDKVEDFVDSAKEKVNEHIPAAKGAIDNVVETVKEKAGEFADKAEEMAGSASSLGSIEIALQ